MFRLGKTGGVEKVEREHFFLVLTDQEEQYTS